MRSAAPPPVVIDYLTWTVHHGCRLFHRVAPRMSDGRLQAVSSTTTPHQHQQHQHLDSQTTEQQSSSPGAAAATATGGDTHTNVNRFLNSTSSRNSFYYNEGKNKATLLPPVVIPAYDFAAVIPMLTGTEGGVGGGSGGTSGSSSITSSFNHLYKTNTTGGTGVQNDTSSSIPFYNSVNHTTLSMMGSSGGARDLLSGGSRGLNGGGGGSSTIRNGNGRGGGGSSSNNNPLALLPMPLRVAPGTYHLPVTNTIISSSSSSSSLKNKNSSIASASAAAPSLSSSRSFGFSFLQHHSAASSEMVESARTMDHQADDDDASSSCWWPGVTRGQLSFMSYVARILVYNALLSMDHRGQGEEDNKNNNTVSGVSSSSIIKPGIVCAGHYAHILMALGLTATTTTTKADSLSSSSSTSTSTFFPSSSSSSSTSSSPSYLSHNDIDGTHTDNQHTHNQDIAAARRYMSELHYGGTIQPYELDDLIRQHAPWMPRSLDDRQSNIQKEQEAAATEQLLQGNRSSISSSSNGNMSSYCPLTVDFYAFIAPSDTFQHLIMSVLDPEAPAAWSAAPPAPPPPSPSPSNYNHHSNHNQAVSQQMNTMRAKRMILWTGAFCRAFELTRRAAIPLAPGMLDAALLPFAAAQYSHHEERQQQQQQQQTNQQQHQQIDQQQQQHDPEVFLRSVMGLVPYVSLAPHSDDPNCDVGVPDEGMRQWLAIEKGYTFATTPLRINNNSSSIKKRKQLEEYKENDAAAAASQAQVQYPPLVVLQARRDIRAGEVLTIDRNTPMGLSRIDFERWIGGRIDGGGNGSTTKVMDDGSHAAENRGGWADGNSSKSSMEAISSSGITAAASATAEATSATAALPLHTPNNTPDDKPAESAYDDVNIDAAAAVAAVADAMSEEGDAAAVAGAGAADVDGGGGSLITSSPPSSTNSVGPDTTTMTTMASSSSVETSSTPFSAPVSADAGNSVVVPDTPAPPVPSASASATQEEEEGDDLFF